MEGKQKYISRFSKYWFVMGLLSLLVVELYNLINGYPMGLGLIVYLLCIMISYLMELCVWHRKGDGK